MDTTKHQCSRCREIKPLSAFSPSSRGRRNAYCKPCRVSYQREWLRKKKNKDAHHKLSEEAKQRLKRIVDDFKDVPCSDCRTRYPAYVMECDHVRGTKVASLARLVRRGNKQVLLDELEKCEAVCTNCHAIRTHVRRSVADD